jgi:hypothetical protein
MGDKLPLGFVRGTLYIAGNPAKMIKKSIHLFFISDHQGKNGQKLKI